MGGGWYLPGIEQQPGAGVGVVFCLLFGTAAWIPLLRPHGPQAPGCRKNRLEWGSQVCQGPEIHSGLQSPEGHTSRFHAPFQLPLVQCPFICSSPELPLKNLFEDRILWCENSSQTTAPTLNYSDGQRAPKGKYLSQRMAMREPCLGPGLLPPSYIAFPPGLSDLPLTRACVGGAS